MWWRRRTDPALALAAGERVLAELDLATGRAVATTHRLIVLRDGHQRWDRAWWDLEAVGVESEERILVVTDVEDDFVALSLAEGDQTRFAAVLRERVQATLVDHRTLQVPGGAVRVALRKRDGRLFLQEKWSGQADRTDPGHRARADQVRRELAGSVARPDLAAHG